MNALDDVTVADVEQSIFAPEAAATARSTSNKAASSGQAAELFYAFGIYHDHPSETKTKLVVESIINVDEDLRKVPVIERVLRTRSPKEPGYLTCFLGRERSVSLPHPFGGHARLEHTGVIAAETHKRLRTTNDPQAEHYIDIERGELRQGILAVRKKEATDLCLIHVRLVLQSDDTAPALGGFVLVA